MYVVRQSQSMGRSVRSVGGVLALRLTRDRCAGCWQCCACALRGLKRSQAEPVSLPDLKLALRPEPPPSPLPHTHSHTHQHTHTPHTPAPPLATTLRAARRVSDVPQLTRTHHVAGAWSVSGGSNLRLSPGPESLEPPRALGPPQAGRAPPHLPHRRSAAVARARGLAASPPRRRLCAAPRRAAPAARSLPTRVYLRHAFRKPLNPGLTR